MGVAAELLKTAAKGLEEGIGVVVSKFASKGATEAAEAAAGAGVKQGVEAAATAGTKKVAEKGAETVVRATGDDAAVETAKALQETAKAQAATAMAQTATAKSMRKGFGLKGTAAFGGTTLVAGAGGGVYLTHEYNKASAGGIKPGNPGAPTQEGFFSDVKKWAADHTQDGKPFGIGSIIAGLALGMIGFFAAPGTVLVGLALTAIGALGGQKVLKALGQETTTAPAATTSPAANPAEPASSEDHPEVVVPPTPTVAPKDRAPASPVRP